LIQHGDNLQNKAMSNHETTAIMEHLNG